MAVTAPASELLADGELVQHTLAGDRRAFELLVRRHNQRLFRAARAVVRADVEAEDVLQQAWLEVYRHLASFRGDAAFATWATRIAVNAAITFARRRPQIAEVTDEPDPDPTRAPADVAERAELGRLLQACVEQLPQGNREVMVLRDVLELDTAETAACLGLTEEAVRVRLHRARAAVAATLTERMTDEARRLYTFDGARCDRITARVLAAVWGA